MGPEPLAGFCEIGKELLSSINSGNFLIRRMIVSFSRSILFYVVSYVSYVTENSGQIDVILGMSSKFQALQTINILRLNDCSEKNLLCNRCK